VSQSNGVLSLTPAGGGGQTISVSDGTSTGATQLFGASSVTNNSTTIPSGGLPLTLTVDGSQASVTLGAGIYTPAQLATALQTAINTSSTLQQSGVSVNVTQNNGVLSIASTSFGSKSSVSLIGTGVTQLFGSSAAITAGVDVQGTIGGYAATGNGQVLTVGNSGPAAGLTIQVAGSSTGPLGAINYSQGYAAQLNAIVTSATDPTSGSIVGATNALNTQITSLQTQQTKLQTYISQVQQQYQTQFSALDAMVAKLNSTASFLQQIFNPTTTSS
jgi:flagellar hook-associated protein 2